MDPILNTSLDFGSPFTGATSPMNGDAYAQPVGSNRALDQDSLALLERNLQEAQERYNAIRQQRNPVLQHYQQPTTTPLWDEISRIQDSLSSNQLKYLESIPEFTASSNQVAAILNREYMRVMRPIVEGTPDGKAALQKHLEVVRRLVKQAKDAADQQAMLMSDYTQHYSHLTFEQYLKMIHGGNQSSEKEPKKQSK